MAKFTSTQHLNLEWANHHFVGTAGTTHRVTDALVEEFTVEVQPQIPGFSWVTQDELTSIVTLPIAQTDVTGLTADLAAKYPKAGGTVDGSTTVTGTLGVGGAVTMSSTLVVTSGITASSLSATGTVRAGNNLNVTNSITGADISLTGAAAIGGAATVTGVLTALGAANMSSTLGVTGKITLGAGLQAGGTAFPGSPATNDQFYRTDHRLWFFFDGTRWLSTDLFHASYVFRSTTGSDLLSATTGAIVLPVPPNDGTDIWLVDFQAQIFVASGGTALGASHKWVGTLAKRIADNTGTTIVTTNIDSGASATWRTFITAIDALLNSGTTHYAFVHTWTKTGTPGNLQSMETLTYRLVAT